MDIIVNNLKSQIITDNPKLLKALRSIYTFNVKGANYSPQYRSGMWDGKKSFITPGGKFSTGLLDDILKRLAKIDCVPDIQDNRPSTPEVPLETIEGFVYRDYQEELIRKTLHMKRLVVQSSTGSGKTLIMAGIIKSLKPRKMVILFHEKQILKQTYDFLLKCGIEDVGVNFGEGFIYGDIMLSTVQSIEKILDTHLEEAEVLMIDEVHEFCSGKGRLAAIESFPNAEYRVGLTATVPKDDIKYHNLVAALGTVCKVLDTADLIEKGKLVKPTIKTIKINYSQETQEEYAVSDYLSIYEEFITNNEIRNNEIKNLVLSNQGENNRILIIVQNLEHGQILNNLIPGSCYIKGEDSISSRYEHIKEFVSGKTSCLIGTKILQTGVNIEEVTHIINARGLQSDIATLQALGRALRIHENKEKATIFEFDDNLKYLHKHFNKRMKHYKAEGHTIEKIKEIEYEG